MPEIEIRPAVSSDIPILVAIDHSYTSDTVWQMEIQSLADDQIKVSFRQTRLPRSVRVEYPRPYRALIDDWIRRSGLLVALFESAPVGYVSLMLNISPMTTWVTDLAVNRRMRRQGIGSTLLLASLEWAANHDCRYLILEMQPKNYPAIQMAQKLGFNFCGYNDHYFANHDIGLFFAKAQR